jgi:hypothetical protein
MLNTFLCKQKWVFGFLVFFSGILYLFFDAIAEKNRCYSQNHEYFIIKNYSIFSYFFPLTFGEYGVAKLYDKNGVLIYEGKTNFNKPAPIWATYNGKGSVGFEGLDTTWFTTLPTPPGHADGCHRQ